MGWSYFHRFCTIVVFLLSLLATSFASTFISDGLFADHSLVGRNLLQARKSCPVNFEFQNYMIITSQCRGPQYPPNACCSALKEFACPFAEQLNDLTNDCATTMFSYINIYGKYPPGLFSSECREGKEGIACPALPPSQSSPSGSLLTCKPSQLLILVAAFLVLLRLM